MEFKKKINIIRIKLLVKHYPNLSEVCKEVKESNFLYLKAPGQEIFWN